MKHLIRERKKKINIETRHVNEARFEERDYYY